MYSKPKKGKISWSPTLDNVMNLRKIAITAAGGVLTGDRKLYQKARSLLNCTNTESELKLALSVS